MPCSAGVASAGVRISKEMFLGHRTASECLPSGYDSRVIPRGGGFMGARSDPPPPCCKEQWTS